MDPNMVQHAIDAVNDIAYAKAAKEKNNILMSGKNEIPQYDTLKNKQKNLKDQLYVWMRCRHSLCSVVEIVPTYPPNTQQIALRAYAFFSLKYEYKKQKPLWIVDRLKDLIADTNGTFNHTFLFHISLIQSLPQNTVTIANFFRRIVLDAVSARAATLKAKFDIKTTDPKSGKVVKRVAPSAVNDAERGVKIARLANGETLRMETSVADASDNSAIISYYNLEKEVSKCWKKSDAIQKREVLHLKVCQAQSLPNIPLPIAAVNLQYALEAVERLKGDDKFAETRMCMSYTGEIEPLQQDGNTEAYMVPQDNIIPPPPNFYDWRSWFATTMTDYISTQREFQALSTTHKGKVKKDMIKPERLLHEPENPQEYWETHFDDKETVDAKKKEVKEAFNARVLDSVLSGGVDQSAATKTLSVKVKDETGADQEAEVSFNIGGLEAETPASTVGWMELAGAVTAGLAQAAHNATQVTNTQINLNMAVSTLNEQSLRDLWGLIVNQGQLIGYVTHDMNVKLNTTATKADPVSVKLKKDKGPTNALYI
jgi:hypothetical protein